LIAFDKSDEIFATRSFGVAPAATMPTMLSALTPGTVSATTGMGELAMRCGLSSAIGLILPELMSGCTA
jgi:hypothetical protein